MDSTIQNMSDVAISQVTAPQRLAKTTSMASIDKAAKDFEGMFASQMLQPMFEGIETDPMFGGGHGEEIMRSFLIQEYGKTIANSGVLNLSSAIKNTMLKAQHLPQEEDENANTY
jgi:Rod binding domain-containing protein